MNLCSDFSRALQAAAAPRTAPEPPAPPDCPICLESMEGMNPENVKVLGCCHKVCGECWAQQTRDG